MASLEGNLEGSHWDSLRDLLPIYRAITTVAVGNGRSTSFWHDVWSGDDSLADRFPSLLSHCTSTSQIVQEVCASGLQQFLVPRLSGAAVAELDLIKKLTENICLTETRDKRLSPMIGLDGSLQTSTLYKLLKSGQGTLDAAAKFIWSRTTPPRVQFFGWLLVHDRVQSKENLHKKKIVDDAVCDLCGHDAKTTTHLLFKCPMASSFWRALGIQIPPGFTVSSLHTLQAPPHVPAAHFETLVLLCCWQLWKRWNGIVFRQEHVTLHQLLAGCKAEARLWVARLPRQDIAVGDQWCSFFSLAM